MKEPLQWYVKTMSKQSPFFPSQWWPLFTDICIPLPFSLSITPFFSAHLFLFYLAFSPHQAQTGEQEITAIRTGPDSAPESLPNQFNSSLPRTPTQEDTWTLQPQGFIFKLAF